MRFERNAWNGARAHPDWGQAATKLRLAKKVIADALVKDFGATATGAALVASGVTKESLAEAVAMRAVYGVGVEAALAFSHEHTKERRDAMRKLTDSAAVITTDETDVWSFPKGSSWDNKASFRGSFITARNRLTQRQLKAACLGVIHVGHIGRKRADLDVGYYNTLAVIDTVETIIADAFALVSEDLMTAKTTEPTTTKETDMGDEAKLAATAKAIDEKIAGIDKVARGLIDQNLKGLGLPDLKGISETVSAMAVAIGSRPRGGLKITLGEAMKEAQAIGGLPEGKCELKSAADLFGLTGKAAAPFKFDVPIWSWDSAHPDVPETDPDYEFQPQLLLNVLTALVTNQRLWMYGDTGCGKTTLIEQAMARLNYPVIRINMDSEVTRMDFIGKPDIVVKGGHPVTEFTDGVLPRAMQMPCILLVDEVDYIQADVAYLFQPVLEGRNLTLLEDNGRIIQPHSGFRIMATANTQGNGDETGRYQGAKPQSAAFLDRFTLWCKANYMKQVQVERLLTTKYPSLGDKAAVLAAYAHEHWKAFSAGEVLTPLSPRGLLSCAMTYSMFSGLMSDKAALNEAMTTSFIDRANPEDQATIKGLISRVVS